jgi:glycerol-3-phosphate acyltransferase PlsY
MISILPGYFVLAISAYLLGSVPMALIMSALLKRRDLRSIGSGNLSVYNTLFNVGKLPAALTIAGHGALAASAVMLARLLHPADEVALLIAIAAVTTGNMWQVFARFRGSRGSTILGWALLIAHPPLWAAMTAVWVATLMVRRRTLTATRVLHAVTPAILGLVAWSWTWAIGGAVIAVLLEVKCLRSIDDTLELGLFRRFGVNDPR